MNTKLENATAHIGESPDGENCCGASPTPNKEHKINFKIYLPALFSFLMLGVGIVLDYTKVSFFRGAVPLIWYLIAYIPVGFPVLKQGWKAILNGDFFTEFFLMGIATIGAFALGHYHEGVAVMLFYAVGELFEHSAVDKSKQNIQALLDIRHNSALVYREGSYVSIHP